MNITNISLTRNNQVTEISSVNEQGYFAKNIHQAREKAKAHKLRHKVFCQELGWVEGTADMLEMDAYDENAQFVGVFDAQQNLKAFARIVLPGQTFMMEREFRDLVGADHQIRKKDDTAEISRLCVESEARNERFSASFGVQNISMLLYKGLYRLCLQQRIRYLYLVVEEKVFRLLCAKGFPCTSVGEPKVMPDGVIAVAAMLDRRKFERLSKLKRPKMFSWFSQHQSALPSSQSRQREPGSRHPVFS